MTVVDFDKKAARYWKRKNKAIAKAYPLFADEFAVSQEQAEEHVLEQAYRGERFLEYLKECKRRRWFKLELYKRFAYSIGMESVVMEAYQFYERQHISDTAILLDKICNDIADKLGINRQEMYHIINEDHKHLMPCSYEQKVIYH